MNWVNKVRLGIVRASFGVLESMVGFLASAVCIIPDKAFDMLPEDWQDVVNALEQRLEPRETARR
ncbi:MAG: hypothetical protein HQ475_14320 [SAR202 cluster bacterium]|nr:hypothetical protein [SAR202 cluster bacterium]